jgi:hypothetical protein
LLSHSALLYFVVVVIFLVFVVSPKVYHIGAKGGCLLVSQNENENENENTTTTTTTTTNTTTTTTTTTTRC